MTVRIGIDVGGTNTDAVAIDEADVVASGKFATTPDVLGGVAAALRHIVAEIDATQVHSVVIGTTHFVNAVTEARHLSPVIAIRLATPPQPLPPFTDWPERLREVVQGRVEVLAGGHQFTGDPLNAADLDGVRRVVRWGQDAGHLDYMISSVFSPVNPDGERAARDVVLQMCPTARITMSHQLGRIGLLERENAALLNAALRPLAVQVVDGFRGVLSAVGLDVPLYLSQNDGTVMNLEAAREFPITTVASGPTNSMRGAALGSGLGDCVVVDVGGTTADIGLLQGGFPRESTLTVDLGAVRTNFRMPDVVSVGLGGGSLVRETDRGVTVGPDSVGYELRTRALVFGGDELTLTDVAVAAGHAVIGDPSLVDHLDHDVVRRAMAAAIETVGRHIDRVKVRPGDVPVVLVGGGATLLGTDLPGASQVILPDDAGVANAIGAAMANVGGDVDRVFSLTGTTRDLVMQQARDEAITKAVTAGALASTIRVVDEEDIPLTHVPDGVATRVRVRVIGDTAVLGAGAAGQTEATRA